MDGHQRSNMPQRCPDFQTIQEQIEAERIASKNQIVIYLNLYDQNRKRFDEQGISHQHSSLLKAFCWQLEDIYAPLKETSLLKSLCLFSSLLMFREFELVMWSYFSRQKDIDQIVKDEQIQKNSANICTKIINHLVNTAYYCKNQVTSEEEFESFKAFFNQYFSIFEGKHTDWLLLNEPDMSTLTPQVINLRYEELIKEFQKRMPANPNQNKRQYDYNNMVSKLNEEAQKEAHNNYMAKLRKQKDQELRTQRKEQRRAAKLEAAKNRRRKTAESIDTSGIDCKGSSFGGKDRSGHSDGTRTEKSEFSNQESQQRGMMGSSKVISNEQVEKGILTVENQISQNPQYVSDMAQPNNFGAQSLTMMDRMVSNSGMILNNNNTLHEPHHQDPAQNLNFNFNESLANHNWQNQMKDARVLMNQINQEGEMQNLIASKSNFRQVRSGMFIEPNYNMAGSSSFNKPTGQYTRGASLLGLTFNQALQNNQPGNAYWNGQPVNHQAFNLTGGIPFISNPSSFAARNEDPQKMNSIGVPNLSSNQSNPPIQGSENQQQQLMQHVSNFLSQSQQQGSFNSLMNNQFNYNNNMLGAGKQQHFPAFMGTVPFIGSSGNPICTSGQIMAPCADMLKSNSFQAPNSIISGSPSKANRQNFVQPVFDQSMLRKNPIQNNMQQVYFNANAGLLQAPNKQPLMGIVKPPSGGGTYHATSSMHKSKQTTSSNGGNISLEKQSSNSGGQFLQQFQPPQE